MTEDVPTYANDVATLFCLIRFLDTDGWKRAESIVKRMTAKIDRLRKMKEYTIPSMVLDVLQKETDWQAEIGCEPGFLDYAQALTDAIVQTDPEQ